ncbi:hypothetical protein L1887_19958 [Cichorium endivia]|nr:hypothetical protein L1887_19958 [Cichorium endivia]
MNAGNKSVEIHLLDYMHLGYNIVRQSPLTNFSIELTSTSTFLLPPHTSLLHRSRGITKTRKKNSKIKSVIKFDLPIDTSQEKDRNHEVVPG